jgi:ribosomal protein S18 acetylase RimI-like enzyme
MEIKTVKLSDLNSLMEISRETFYETFAKDNSIEDTNKYLSENVTEEKLTKELNNTNSRFYFCYFKSELAGYLKVNISTAQTESLLPDALEIERIYILNKFHGQGLGKALMEKAIQTTKELSINEIWLGVWEHNIKALKFYNKLGFNQFSQHIFKLGEDEQTDILMKLDLC